MSDHVVCISRALAAGGEDVGRAVADGLGYRYVDEEIILKAAELAQVAPSVVAATEHRQPLLRRLIDKLAAAQELAGPMTLVTGVPMDFAPPRAVPSGDPDDLRVLIRAAIHEVAMTGKAVIVAHAASYALAGQAGVLRVLVTASDKVRAQRLGEARKLSAKQAEAEVAKSDGERAFYLREFYGIKQELPTHYDLVVNTDTLTPAQAAALIVHAVLR